MSRRFSFSYLWILVFLNSLFCGVPQCLHLSSLFSWLCVTKQAASPLDRWWLIFLCRTKNISFLYALSTRMHVAAKRGQSHSNDLNNQWIFLCRWDNNYFFHLVSGQGSYFHQFMSPMPSPFHCEDTNVPFYQNQWQLNHNNCGKRECSRACLCWGWA